MDAQEKKLREEYRTKVNGMGLGDLVNEMLGIVHDDPSVLYDSVAISSLPNKERYEFVKDVLNMRGNQYSELPIDLLRC